MTDSVSIPDHLLTRGRQLLHMGRTAEARACLNRLLDLPNPSVTVRAEAHQLLGQVDSGCQRFRRARRHYRAAIRLRPYDAELYCRYAGAVAADPHGDSRLGRAALRRAVGISPFEPRYWSALGTASLRMGLDRKAVRAFRRAARLRPDDPATLADVVDGFIALNRWSEARAVLTAARLRAPADVGIRQLESRARFELARRDQEAARRDPTAETVLLKFPGRVTDHVAAAGTPGIVRVDLRSHPRPHVLRMLDVRPDPRQAR